MCMNITLQAIQMQNGKEYSRKKACDDNIRWLPGLWEVDSSGDSETQKL